MSRYLLDKGANPSLVDSAGNDFFSYSISSGKSDMVEFVLTVVKEPSKRSLNIALIECIYKKLGSLATIKTLIDLGADVNYQNASQATALHWAVSHTNTPMVRLLLDAGANPELVDNAGNDAILLAANRPAIAEILRDAVRRRAAGTPAPVVRPPSPVPANEESQPLMRPAFNAPQDEHAYAVIVGIDKYPDLPAASYAERDADAAKHFIRALGVPERNIMFLTGSRATKTGMEKTIEAWLPNNVAEKSRVYFYYSGHGAPDVKTGDAYLVPFDGDPQYLAQTGYPLKRLYEKLGQLKVKSVLVTLDSCFSGTGGRSVLAKGTRPLVGKVDMPVGSDGKLSVLSASAGDQVSGANDAAGYGLFTYNFLQGLNGAAKDSQGQVTLKSLYAYLKPRVQDEARRENREQTPQLQSGGDVIILRSK